MFERRRVINQRKLNMSFLSVLILMLTFSWHCSKESAVPAGTQTIIPAGITEVRQPLFVGRPAENQLTVKLSVSDAQKPLELNKVELSFSSESRLTGLEQVSINYSGTANTTGSPVEFGKSIAIEKQIQVSGSQKLENGFHFLNVTFTLKSNPDLTTGFHVNEVKLYFQNHEPITVQNSGNFMFRPALVLRAAGQDDVNTYRIPGLVTTSDGTLIAVYDVRHHSSKDLQEDIDIGMSRSTDGGQTWEPMKIIMDMDEWGGHPQNENGTGDPCVLYDTRNHTLWVAALWLSGSSPDKALWWASQPGMSPDVTGQFLLVKSTDDGRNWSKPINITPQIKDPAWQLLLQGPGRGITMSDGTLVFPAQFKSDTGTKAVDGGQYTCHSTIVYSKDGGNTWHIGTGAKSNTTESQVVQLADGSLMLNMRDDRNRKDKGDTNGRAVAVTSDLGKTWTVHPSSNSALPEPNCQASLISATVKLNGKMQQVLFFSNPNDKNDRINMTIKASIDEGLTWPAAYQTELNSANGYGYSCMTMVDENTIGIVYEGEKELYFQKLPVSDLLGTLMR